MEGWVNIDSHPVPSVTDATLDLDHLGRHALDRFSPVTSVFASHLIEHLANPLGLMEALWFAAGDECEAEFRCPYGSSDDADEDPTHVRRMFLQSWGYFSQPYHWRSGGYGYRGDWQTEKVELLVTQAVVDEAGSTERLNRMLARDRNVVLEMRAYLRVVKPARAAERGLMEAPDVVWVPAEEG